MHTIRFVGSLIAVSTAMLSIAPRALAEGSSPANRPPAAAHANPSDGARYYHSGGQSSRVTPRVYTGEGPSAARTIIASAPGKYWTSGPSGAPAHPYESERTHGVARRAVKRPGSEGSVGVGALRIFVGKPVTASVDEGVRGQSTTVSRTRGIAIVPKADAVNKDGTAKSIKGALVSDFKTESGGGVSPLSSYSATGRTKLVGGKTTASVTTDYHAVDDTVRHTVDAHGNVETKSIEHRGHAPTAAAAEGDRAAAHDLAQFADKMKLERALDKNARSTSVGAATATPR